MNLSRKEEKGIYTIHVLIATKLIKVDDHSQLRDNCFKGEKSAFIHRSVVSTTKELCSGVSGFALLRGLQMKRKPAHHRDP